MKTKNFLPLLILGQTFLANGHVHAQDQIVSKSKNESVEDAKLKEANSSWDKMTDYLKNQFSNASLITSNRLIGIGSKPGFNAGIDLQYGSVPSVSGKYYSLDVWNINLGYLHHSGAGVKGAREVTYIKQFNNRRDSLVRNAYNPISLLPKTSEKALAMEENSFVGYRIPLTFSISSELAKSLNSSFKLDRDIILFSTSEVIVHIYRMPDNKVRVRLFALKDKGIEGRVGLKALGFNRVVVNLLDLNPLDIYGSVASTDLFSVDYVFNLNHQDARQMYDMLLNERFNISSSETLKQQVLSAVPNKSVNQLKEMLYADLDAIQAVVDKDSAKSINDRSIIRLKNVESKTSSSTFGVAGSITRLLSFNAKRVDATTNLSVTTVENNNNKYILSSITKEFNYELFTLFGAANKNESSLLLTADENSKAKDVAGFQTRRYKKELNFKQDELVSLKSRLERNLPSEIFNQIKWPNWKFVNGGLTNVEIEQILFFNVPAMHISNFSESLVQKEMLNIFKKWGRFSSLPNGAEEKDVYGRTDARLDLFNQKKYSDAYSEELVTIPRYLNVVLNQTYDIDTRTQYFGYLQNIALFNEIGPVLMLNLIPKDQLENAVNYKLLIGGSDINNVRGEESIYPANLNKQTRLNVVAASTSEVMNSNDRTFNIRLFINEKGESIGLEELVNKSK